MWVDVLTSLAWQLPSAAILAVMVLVSMGLFVQRAPVSGAAMLAATVLHIARLATGIAWSLSLSLQWVDFLDYDLDTIQQIFLARGALNTSLFTVQLALMLFAALHGRETVRRE